MQKDTSNLRYETAITSPDADKWYAAMKKEHDTLVKLDSWTLVERPVNRKVLTNTWVYAIKLKKDGTVDRYKARIVAHGFRQRPGIDYMSTTTPVARASSVKLMLTVAHALSLEVHQYDVTAAFINAPIDVDIYMQQPKGFVSEEIPNHVCKLNKGLYGLKQAANSWYNMLVQILVDLGLEEIFSDRCLFIKIDPDDYIMILVYVNDILIMCKKPESLDQIIKKMRQEFDLVYRGKISHFLGMEVNFDPVRGYSMSQTVFIKSILEKNEYTNCRTVSTPLVPNEEIKASSEEDTRVDQTKYREILGMLSYLATHTRPDIAQTVSKLAQHQSDPCVRHMNAIHHILRYLKGTLEIKLWVNGLNGLEEKQFADASYASNVPDRSSVSGFVTFIGDAVVEWGSKKQNAAVSCTAEAELVAANKGHKHARYFIQLLRELKVPNWTDHVPILLCDNQAVVEMCKAKKNLSAEMRHVDIKYQELLKQAHNGHVRVEHIGTADQLADGLTKTLPAPANLRMRAGLHLID